MEQYGIDETIDVLEFGFSFSSTIQEALKNDGKVDFKDAMLFVGLLFNQLPKAITGIQLVPKELKDLSDDERIELVSYFEDRFDLPNDELEALIERCLTNVISLAELVKDIVQFKN